MWLKKIPSNKVCDIIDEYKLESYSRIWHYSFQKNLLRQEFILKKTLTGNISLFAKPYNRWSPAPLFTNFQSMHNLKAYNVVYKKYDCNDIKIRKIFWYLKLDTLEDYLDRRTKASTKPGKHFPTSKNYIKKRYQVEGEMEIIPFDKSFFNKYYNQLKQQEHYNANQIVESLNNNNIGLPKDWIRIATLAHKNNIVAIFLFIDDGKSISLFNLATKRHRLSFGLVLCTDLIRYFSNRGYYSFDAGVSGRYGTYKEKIFLDSMDVKQVD